MTGMFEVLAGQDREEQERLTGTRAAIAAQTRAKARFDSFLAKASDDAEREARLALIDSNLRTLANEAAEEYDADPEKTYKAATVALGGGHASDCSCGFCENMGNLPGSDSAGNQNPDDDNDEDGEEEESSVKTACAHCDCGSEDCDCSEDSPCGHEGCKFSKEAKLAKWEVVGWLRGQTPSDFPSTRDDPRGDRPGWTDEQEVQEQLHPRTYQRTRLDNPLQHDKPTVYAPAWNNGINRLMSDAEQRNLAEAEANLGQMPEGMDPEAWEIHQQRLQQMASTKTADGPEEPAGADHYQQERVDLPNNDSDGLGSEGSPKIDKSNSGDEKGWNTDVIDVGSVRHRNQHQEVGQGWKAEELHDRVVLRNDDLNKPLDPRDSPLIKDVDVTEAISVPEGGRTKTFPNQKQQADPVTDSVLSKWTVVE